MAVPQEEELESIKFVVNTTEKNRFDYEPDSLRLTVEQHVEPSAARIYGAMNHAQHEPNW